jgi:hypothetical protein
MIKRAATIQPVSIEPAHNTLLNQCMMPPAVHLHLLKRSVLSQPAHARMNHFLPVLSIFPLQHLNHIHELFFFLLRHIVGPNGVGQLILCVVHFNFFLLQFVFNLFLFPEELALFSRQLHIHHI